MARYKLNGAIAAYVPKHPSTAIDLARLKTSTATLTFNDRVEGYYYKLIAQQRFRALMDTVVSYSSVEGSVTADEYAAARMVRDAAKADKDDIVAEAKAETFKVKRGGRTMEVTTAHGDQRVLHSLRVVASRHQMNRNKRRKAAIEALKLHQVQQGSTDTAQ